MNPYVEIEEYLEKSAGVLKVTTFPLRDAGSVEEICTRVYTREDLEQQEEYKNYLQGGTPVLEQSGQAQTFADPFFPKERVLLFGGGHIALPLCKIAAMAGFSVTVVDDRPEFANELRFPEADEVLCDSFSSAVKKLRIAPQDFLVIITRGHKHDKECLREIFKLPETIYTGMIGSRRRIATVYEELESEGYETGRMARICSPIGLDIGSATTEEIAISIVAELIKRKRKDSPGRFFVNRSDVDSWMVSSIAEETEDFSLVTILETQGSVPRKAGARMKVFETGMIEGSIGGGCSESAIMHEARKLIGTGQWMIRTIDLTPDEAEEEGMVCGGTMKVLIEDMT